MRVEWARYPFISEAKEGVRREAGNEITEEIIERATNRVIQAIKHKRIQMISHLNSSDIEIDIKSYIIARIMVSLINRKLENYIEGETKRALEYAQHHGQENYLFQQLGVEIKENRVSLKDYLRIIGPFTKMKLANRIVKEGWVELTDPERGVLLKEAIRREISKGLPISANLIPEELKKRLEPYLKQIQDEIAIKFKEFKGGSKDIAPCIQVIIDKLRRGDKVSHIERWVMAVFLINRGWDLDRITNIFANQENFNERTTKYQLQHIKSKGYSMPSCATLKTQGVCIQNCGIKNPLQYRKGKS